MATGRISKETVGRLQTSSAAAFLWDDELKGFGVRVTTSGSKTYVFHNRMGGREAKTQRYTIGRHGSPGTDATARKAAEFGKSALGERGDQKVYTQGVDEELKKKTIQ